MISPPFPNRNFMQMCWVVTDVHAAIEAWAQSAGVGPFFLFDGVPFQDGHYRGEPADFPDVTAAIAQAGDVQIEFVCQNDDQPSIFRDLVPAGQSGFHHMALYCNDYETDRAAYTQAGAAIAFEGRMMGIARTGWMDTAPTLGFMVELIEANEMAEGLFGQISDAARNWDGKDPIRTLPQSPVI